MPTQVENGKAFEFACLNALYRFLSPNQPVEIIQNESYLKALNSFNGLDNGSRADMTLAAEAALTVITRLEPLLENPLTYRPLYLSIQTDMRGRAGDVRDILAIRRQNEWEIGISAKNNHSAVKHSRLSGVLDFGQEWLGIPCSQAYFNRISPLFNELRQLQSRKVKWRDLIDKAERFYIPLLTAFIEELRQIHTNNRNAQPPIPFRLVSYLLGRKDFYKVIAHHAERTTEVQAFSLYGTLNKPAGNINPRTRLPRLQLPNDFDRIEFMPRSNNTVRIACNENWNITARIHNADTYVEPSLKFDIQLPGIPAHIYKHHEEWAE